MSAYFLSLQIAQLTYENHNLKERLRLLTTISNERLKEYEECSRQLEMRDEMPFCNRVFISTSLTLNWKFCNIRYVVFIL